MPADGPILIHIQIALSGFSGLNTLHTHTHTYTKIRGNKDEGSNKGTGAEGMESGLAQSTLYTCMKFSSNKET